MNKTELELVGELNDPSSKDREFTTTIEGAIAEQYRNGRSFEADEHKCRR